MRYGRLGSARNGPGGSTASDEGACKGLVQGCLAGRWYSIADLLCLAILLYIAAPAIGGVMRLQSLRLWGPVCNPCRRSRSGRLLL